MKRLLRSFVVPEEDDKGEGTDVDASEVGSQSGNGVTWAVEGVGTGKLAADPLPNACEVRVRVDLGIVQCIDVGVKADTAKDLGYSVSS